jgi:hypothetical protein
MQALQIIKKTPMNLPIKVLVGNENDLAVYGFEQSSFGSRAKGRDKVRSTGQGKGVRV